MYVQIVKFKLKSDSSREKFLELTSQMITTLKGMEGFVAYELYEGYGCWSDRIAWQSEKHAADGRNAFLSTSIAKQIVKMVEDDHSSFFGWAVATAASQCFD